MSERTNKTSGTTVYGLTRPTIADLRRTIATVYRDADESMWNQLVARAGVTDVKAPAAVDNVIGAARDSADEVLALCGRAQHIRLVAHRQLSAVREALSGAAG